jgi:uncharacterized protein (TIGR02117 family)
MPAYRLILLCLLLLAGCAAPVSDPPTGQAVVYVIERGWHTDIGLPVSELSGPLSIMPADYPGATYLTFGFGERQFLLTRHTSVFLMLSALFPSHSALLMTAIKAPPEDAFDSRNVAMMHISPDALADLKAALWAAFEKGPDGKPLRLADGPYLGSTFYAGSDTYAGYFTCNTWVAKMLEAGGLIDSTRGVLFSGQAMHLARGVAARQIAPGPAYRAGGAW